MFEMKEARMFSGLYSRLWLLEGACEQCRLLAAIILVSFAHSFIQVDFVLWDGTAPLDSPVSVAHVVDISSQASVTS